MNFTHSSIILQKGIVLIGYEHYATGGIQLPPTEIK